MVSGETDTGVILPEKLEEARQLDNITVYEWWPARASWTYIGLNMRRDDAATKDINVRRGIAYAIDKDVLTEEIMEGQAKRQCSVFPDTSWAYTSDVACYDYNSEQAIAEFAKSGYTYEDGTMMTPDGEPLTLKLIYGPNTNKVRELIAVYVQDNLADIGVTVEIQAMEWASFLEAKNLPEGWDMFIAGWSSTIEPQFMDQIWSEENIPQLNSVGYINKDVDALFKEAGQNCDLEFRKEKFAEIQQILADDVPYVFLYYSKTWSGQNKRIGGIDPKPVGIAWNSLDWHILEDPGQ
jgi:peptide/nickel transport system substrate-binding protein